METEERGPHTAKSGYDFYYLEEEEEEEEEEMVYSKLTQ